MTSTEGKARQPLKSAEGPAKLVETKGYSTTTILSSLKKCEARQQLRRGTASGESIPASRVAERVFGVRGGGGWTGAVEAPFDGHSHREPR